MIRPFAPAGRYLRRGLLLAVCAAVAGLGVYGCASSGAGEKGVRKAEGSAPGGSAAAQKTKRAYPVRAEVVKLRPIQYELKAKGNIEPQDVFRIDARVPGTLYDVNFKEGDPVKTSAVLCFIAPEAYRLTAAKNEAIYRQAVAAVADAKRRYENNIERAKIRLTEAALEASRRKSVKEQGAISDEEIRIYESRRDVSEVDVKDMSEGIKTEIKMLEATVAEKEAQWKIAEEDVRKATVRPPIDGIIEQRMVSSGMYVTAGTPLATMVDRSSLKLRFLVAEKDSSAITIGTKVKFSVPAWPGQEFEADVYHISGQMDQEGRAVAVWARVTLGVDKLRPGYFAAVNIVTQANVSAVVVPATAVLPSEKGFVSYVVNEGKAELRLVKVGMTVADNEVEIISGLKAGETVVVEGSNALQNGVEVKESGKPDDSRLKKEMPPLQPPQSN